MNEIEFGHATHAGSARESNEDAYLAAPDLGLWVIADGMGGHEAGEVASRIAVEEIDSRVRQGSPLVAAIESAHRRIQTAADQGIGSPGMGATVVALKLDDSRYEIAWVGDSRAYLWDGVLHQLTRDHSYTQLLLDAGLITESEVSQSPYLNVISQGLGVGGPNRETIRVELIVGQLGENHALLLCSDGLSNEVSPETIAAILATAPDNQAKADHLIQAALAAGGKDNVTVILLSRSDPIPLTP